MSKPKPKKARQGSMSEVLYGINGVGGYGYGGTKPTAASVYSAKDEMNQMMIVMMMIAMGGSNGSLMPMVMMMLMKENTKQQVQQQSYHQWYDDQQQHPYQRIEQQQETYLKEGIKEKKQPQSFQFNQRQAQAQQVYNQFYTQSHQIQPPQSNYNNQFYQESERLQQQLNQLYRKYMQLYQKYDQPMLPGGLIQPKPVTSTTPQSYSMLTESSS